MDKQGFTKDKQSTLFLECGLHKDLGRVKKDLEIETRGKLDLYCVKQDLRLFQQKLKKELNQIDKIIDCPNCMVQI